MSDHRIGSSGSPLLATLAGRVVVADRAMGTMLQAADPTLDDFAGLEGCNELLDPGRTGVELSEEFQLHPEQSMSAIVAHHPEAKYFAT